MKCTGRAGCDFSSCRWEAGLTNKSKWLIAVPFALLISVGIPGLIAGKLLWFTPRWNRLAYVAFTGGMWLAATAFVDVRRPRGDPDLANRLIPIGLILSVPLSVWDHLFGFAAELNSSIGFGGLTLSLAAILLGMASRSTLGQAYSPRAGHAGPSELIRRGPYRWIRHPMYLAAILWSLGWPLLIASPLGSALSLIFLLPSIHLRIQSEERVLEKSFGPEFEEYKGKTWRLIPYVY